MEHPVKDIRNVLRSLTQGSPEEQHDAITRYFTPSASFIHPFCRVPSFSDIRVPFSGGTINSRALILAIYKWYKILSPRVDIEIESTVFDERANLLYLTAHQTFSLWFLPFHQARAVRLVTVLHLVAEPLLPNGVHPTLPSPIATTPLGEAPAEPTFAEVASTAVDTSDVVDAATGKPERRLAQAASTTTAVSVGGGGSEGGGRYRIDKQEDLYQVNEFLKFVAMTPGAVVYGWWQLFSTALCILGVLLLGPVVRAVGLEEQQAAGGSGAAQTVGGKR
ncbi:hypothetical protein B0T18DRAFT_401814 [Schizothecium vesticola]|uniref:SigF-like NTF2-like domain-containing protein n=1 Tax=Schizothecium vesticola TaxID=314040 RepID=A0AA40F4L1_9PEZI|nr:hypothetical protein B0T18DRAFT_401814 [Schizothecium vesticola]